MEYNSGVISVQKNIPLSHYTTFEIGGPAKFFVQVSTKFELIEAINFAKEKNLPYLVIGGGSNLLISDEGFSGLIIKNSINSIDQKGTTITVGSGTTLTELINFTVENGLGGLEKLIGIPGSVGGAVYGNAGAYGQTICGNIIEVHALDNGQEIILSKTECEFSYRDSNFKRNHLIILEIVFKLPKADPNILREEMDNTLMDRLKKYPQSLRSAGSFFKNIPVGKVTSESLKLIPEDKINHGKIPVGFLLEAVGAKNESLEDIKVLQNHANTIINTGNGSYYNVLKLAEILAKKVKDKFGIDIEPEVQIISQ